MTATDYIEWAIETIEAHSMSRQGNYSASTKLAEARRLAQLAVDLEVKLEILKQTTQEETE
jgi:hypothetical protein